MTLLRYPPEGPSLASISSPDLVEQLSVILTGMRRIFGDADFATSGVEDTLLSSKFAVYVSPEFGSDDVVFGNYNADRGILKQEYTCGYSMQRPFKSLARAYAEVSRRSILAGTSNDIHDRAVIIYDISDGYLWNGTGAPTVNLWTEGRVTDDQLRMLNDATRPGLIHPRGCTVIGVDYRRSVLRPLFVPSGNGNAITGRAPILRMTGDGYFSNFTIKDNASVASSHHLVHSHEFVSEADLVAYYAKIAIAFNLTGAETVNPGETQIVGPSPDGDPVAGVDTVRNASPYIFGAAMRSELGMCGPLVDGRVATGFRSMEAAQYTLITIQKDMTAFQKYSGGNWVNVTDFADYIATNINDLRYKTSGTADLVTGGTCPLDYRHFGFKEIGDAFIQLVSEFVIGAAVQHWGCSGSDSDLSNCNSAFGGVATLAHGFRGITTAGGSFPQDRGILGVAVRRPLAFNTDGKNIKQIAVGRMASSASYVTDGSGTYLKLSTPFDPVEFLRVNGASLQQNHYIWIDNSDSTSGPGSAINRAFPVYAQLAAVPWTSANPDRIYVQPVTNNSIGQADGAGTAVSLSELHDNRVYIRRLVDNRTPEQREYGLICSFSNTTITRRPPSNFILRLGSRGSVGAQLDPANGTDELFIVTETLNTTVASPVAATNYFKLLLRSGDEGAAYSGSRFYRLAMPVSTGNRVYRSGANQKAVAPPSTSWVGAALPFSDSRGQEHPRSQASPRVVLDKDLSKDRDSTTLGINFDTDTDYLDQIRSATDFLAVAALMVKLGYSASDLGSTGGTFASKILAPQAASARDWDPTALGSPTPSGKLTTKIAWPLEFNKPSLIEARNQIYRYIGLTNYSKSLPKFQRFALETQFKIEAVSMSVFGGRSYADGSIENGLTIQGDKLIDLATGRDTTTEAAGISEFDRDTAVPSLLNGDYTITGSLDVQTNLTVGGDLSVLGAFSTLTVEASDYALEILGLIATPIQQTDQLLINRAGQSYRTSVQDFRSVARFGSMGIGQDAETGFELALTGAAKADIVTLGAGSAIDCRLGNFFTRTATGNITFTFTNPPATGRFSFTLDLTYTSGAITFPASVRWLYDSTPTLITGKRYNIIFLTTNAGTVWLGTVLEYTS